MSGNQFILGKCQQVGRNHESSKQQTQAISDIDAANLHITLLTKNRD